MIVIESSPGTATRISLDRATGQVLSIVRSKTERRDQSAVRTELQYQLAIRLLAREVW